MNDFALLLVSVSGPLPFPGAPVFGRRDSRCTGLAVLNLQTIRLFFRIQCNHLSFPGADLLFIQDSSPWLHYQIT